MKYLLVLSILIAGCQLDHQRQPQDHSGGRECSSCHVYERGSLIVFPDAGFSRDAR